jgi:hypothetical protein
MECRNKNRLAAAKDKMNGQVTVGTAMIGDPIDQDGSPMAIATTTNEVTVIMTAVLDKIVILMLAVSAMNGQLKKNKVEVVIGHAAMNTIIKKKNSTLLIPGMINSM